MRHHQLVVYYAITLSITLRTTFCGAGSDEGIKREDEEEHSLIPLNKCCDIGEFYNAGIDHCLEWENYTATSFLDVPPFYYDDDGRGVHAVTPSAFLLSFENLTFCPLGQIVKSSIDFQLFKNGSMKTVQDMRKSGEFCVDRIMSHEMADNLTAAVFVSRFCIPDPCANKTECVHKCCPNGMLLNEIEKICQHSSVPFEIPFHDESGTPVNKTELLASLVVTDGVFVDCKYGAYSIRPSFDKLDEFYIRPDGRIHLPAHGEYHDDYCIDNFINEDGVALQGLICFPPQPQHPNEHDTTVLSIYPYFLFGSSLFLIATFVVHALLPELRNTHGATVMCHVGSMTVMYIGLGTIQLNHYISDGLCVGLAVTVHFAFLATFTWLNVLSFDIWWTFNDRRLPRRTQKLGRRFAYYSLYAWSVPTIIVAFGQLVDNVDELSKHLYQPEFGILKCWFNTPASLYTYLYGPMTVLILANILFFILTALALCRTRVGMIPKEDASLFYSKQKFRAIFVLFILMGVCWITEVISFVVGGSAYLWIPTDILNILTAVFVFFIFVCKPNVWSLIMKKHPSLQKFDRFCPTCMKYDNGRQENEDRSYLDLQQTAI